MQFIFLYNSVAMSFEDDYKIALRLQKKFDEEASERENSDVQVIKHKRSSEALGTVSLINKTPKKFCLIEKSLEYSDPNPDIHALFLHFNDVFFWSKLLSVEVRWSPRMTSCAGICCYEGRGRLCSIRLSLPLLKLRPRKDLVETLLHEMIHAYLFVTNNNRDRDGHGPEFHKHMHRINQSAGTKITVYHTFHDEVRSYQQHWWQCQGPCRNRKPFFGMVRRAMNRAPGPSDFWWADHQASCGGTFVKIREPEGFSAGKKRSKGPLVKVKGKSSLPKKTLIHSPEEAKPVPSSSKAGILSYFSPKKGDVAADEGRKGAPASLVPPHMPAAKSFVPFSGEGRVLGSKGGPPSQKAPPSKRPRIFQPLPTPKDPNALGPSHSSGGTTVECPVCGTQQPQDTINEHLDKCIACKGPDKSCTPTPAPGEHWRLECPGCRTEVDEKDFDEHLDGCVAVRSEVPSLEASEEEEEEVLPSRECVCPACGVAVAQQRLGDHLEVCLSTMSFYEDME